MCSTPGTAASESRQRVQHDCPRKRLLAQPKKFLLITTKPAIMQSKTFIVLALLIASLSGCKKDKEQNQSPSKTELLTSGQWRLTAYTLSPPVDFDGDGSPDSDALALFEPYNRDDLFRFKADGTLEIDEGPTKALASDPQIKNTTTWAFADNQTVLVIDGDRTALQELTASKLRLTVSVMGTNGDMTFTKQ
jgi:hypothetical protein